MSEEKTAYKANEKSEQYDSETERLRDENRQLREVISRLTLALDKAIALISDSRPKLAASCRKSVEEIQSQIPKEEEFPFT